MSIASVGARGRIFAERTMTDACTIVHPTGVTSLNALTGEVTADVVQVYTGKCRVRPQPGIATRDVRAGDTVIGTHAPIVTVPVSVTGVAAGDIVTVTDSTDPGLVGQTLSVQVVAEGSQISARRLLCQEMSTGGSS